MRINNLISDNSFYNITKSNNNINTNTNTTTKNSNTVSNKYIDIVEQFSDVTKSSNNVANTYNNVVKNYDSISKNSNDVANGSNNENSATENVDPNEYNIPKSTIWIDAAGTYHSLYKQAEGVIYSGGTGSNIVFDLRYAEHSTDENPIISARGQDENGKEFTQLITVNKINPSNATPVEIRVLQVYLSEGQFYETIGNTFLMDGVHGYNEHGQNLNDRNNYISALKDSVALYSYPTYHAPELPIDLSKTLDSFTDFMSKNNIVEHDNSLEIKNAYAKKMLENASNELSKSMSKDKTDLDDEFLKLLDENKEDNNDK